MISKFNKGNRQVIKRLNSIISDSNNSNGVRQRTTKPLTHRYQHRIFWGEVIDAGPASFQGTFYDVNGNKVTSASTDFYDQLIYGKADIGDTFGAIKYEGDWYAITDTGSHGLVFELETIEDAGSDNIIKATVPGDPSGDSWDVYCTIAGGTALNAAIPRLTSGMTICAIFSGYTYEFLCTTIFQASEICEDPST